MIDFEEVNRNIENLPRNVKSRTRTELCEKICDYFSNLREGQYTFKGGHRMGLLRKHRTYYLEVVYFDSLNPTNIHYWNEAERWVPLSYEEDLEKIQWIWDNREKIVREIERNDCL